MHESLEAGVYYFLALFQTARGEAAFVGLMSALAVSIFIRVLPGGLGGLGSGPSKWLRFYDHVDGFVLLIGVSFAIFSESLLAHSFESPFWMLATKSWAIVFVAAAFLKSPFMRVVRGNQGHPVAVDKRRNFVNRCAVSLVCCFAYAFLFIELQFTRGL